AAPVRSIALGILRRHMHSSAMDSTLIAPVVKIIGSSSHPPVSRETVMQQQWRQVLSERGFDIDAASGRARATRIDADTAAPRCVDLNHLTAMRLAGPDAATFLQGYLTCDVRALSADRALFGAYCNIKGRVVADATIALLAGQPTLFVAASVRESIGTSLA